MEPEPLPEGNLVIKLFKSAANVTEMTKQYPWKRFSMQNYPL